MLDRKTMEQIVRPTLSAIMSVRVALESISDEHGGDLSIRIGRYVAYSVLGREPTTEEWHAISLVVAERVAILQAQTDELTPTVFDVLDLSCGCVVRTEPHHDDGEGYMEWVRLCHRAHRVLADDTRLDKLNDHFALAKTRLLARGVGEAALPLEFRDPGKLGGPQP